MLYLRRNPKLKARENTCNYLHIPWQPLITAQKPAINSVGLYEAQTRMGIKMARRVSAFAGKSSIRRGESRCIAVAGATSEWQLRCSCATCWHAWPLERARCCQFDAAPRRLSSRHHASRKRAARVENLFVIGMIDGDSICEDWFGWHGRSNVFCVIGIVISFEFAINFWVYYL